MRLYDFLALDNFLTRGCTVSDLGFSADTIVRRGSLSTDSYQKHQRSAYW